MAAGRCPAPRPPRSRGSRPAARCRGSATSSWPRSSRSTIALAAPRRFRRWTAVEPSSPRRIRALPPRATTMRLIRAGRRRSRRSGARTGSAVSVWSRLAACGQTRDAGPSMTSSMTSSPAVGRQAVEEDRPGGRPAHQARVHGEPGERGPPGVALGLVAHRGPDVGIDRFGSSTRPRPGRGSG